MPLQQPLRVLAGVLAAAIGVRHQSLARQATSHGHLQGIDHQPADHDVPEQLLMSWLGHRDSEMMRHYYRLRQDEARRQMAQIPFLAKSGNESVRHGVEEQRPQE